MSAEHLIVDCKSGEVTTKPVTKAEAAKRARMAKRLAAEADQVQQHRQRMLSLRAKEDRSHEENLELTNHLADLLGVVPTEE